KDPQFVELMQKAGVEPAEDASPAAFQAFIAKEIVLWREAVQIASVTLPEDGSSRHRRPRLAQGFEGGRFNRLAISCSRLSYIDFCGAGLPSGEAGVSGAAGASGD